MKFRNLTEREIEVKVKQVFKDSAMLLLYKDARVDFRLLDETVGPENWQRRHEVIDGRMFCSVGIKCEGEWVWKQDVGVPSDFEGEKGEASDSFKRACYNWGIGRELYTAPAIFVQCETEERNGKHMTKERFFVEQIIVDNGAIVALSIKNSKGSRVFLYDVRPKKEEEKKA